MKQQSLLLAGLVVLASRTVHSSIIITGEDKTETNPECLKCKAVALAGGELYTANSTIEVAMDFFVDTICAQIPPQFGFTGCTQEVRQYWPQMAKGMFGSSDVGWFAPVNHCLDLVDLHCHFKDNTPPPQISCDYCETRLNAASSYFDYTPVMGDIIYGFQFLGFCNQFHLKAAECQMKMAWTLPRIMVQMAKLPGLKEMNAKACKEIVNCV